MKRVSAAKLSELTDLYLKKALKADARFWALGSLCSLAQFDEVEDVTNPISRFSFFKAWIESIIGKPISNQAWNSWLDTNASVLGDKPSKVWKQRDDSTYIWAETSTSQDQWVDTIISPSPRPPKTLAESSASLLQGNSEIPPLYLFSGEINDSQPPSTANPGIAHYDWAVDSINKVTNSYYDSFFNNKIERFIIGNRLKLDSIRRWFLKEPRRLGGGADGVAWDIGGRRILKIFSDTSAYHHALQAVERLHKNPNLARTEAMIYDVGEIGNWEGINIYFYVMERMLALDEMSDIKPPLREIIATIVRQLYKEREHWRQVKALDPNKDSAKIKREVQLGAERYANFVYDTKDDYVTGVEETYNEKDVKIDKDDPKEHKVPLSQNWLLSLAEEVIMKYLTGRTDLHLGNMGVTAYGEFRYFDPAYGKWKSNINLPGMNLEPSAQTPNWEDVEFDN